MGAKTMTTKLMLCCDDKLWDKVKIFSIQNKCENLNEAVVKLIERGLKD